MKLFVVAVVLVSILATAQAQIPFVYSQDKIIAQNVGYLTFTGTGFETDLRTSGAAGQFRFSLVGTAPTTCQPGCVDGTMSINQGGTTMTCLMFYIPDACLPAQTPGDRQLVLTVNNANGVSNPVSLGTINQVTDFIVKSRTTPVPVGVTGICITGAGFPHVGSLRAADILTFTVRDDAAGNVVANAHQQAACSYSRSNVCCRFPVTAFTLGDELSVSVFYGLGGAAGPSTNWAGTTVGTLVANPAAAPVVTVPAVPPTLPQNQRLLTLTGTGFAPSPLHIGNVIAMQNGVTCIPLEATETRIICQLYPYYADAAVGTAVGTLTVTTNGQTSAAVAPFGNVAAVVNRLIPEDQKVPRVGGILRLRGLGFPAASRLFPGAAGNSLFDAANDIVVQLFVDGNPAPIATCQVQPAVYVPFISNVATAPFCVVSDVDATGVTVTYGSAVFGATPIGSTISARVTVLGADVFGGAAPGVAIGTLVAFGVGGDPHFFGFLGERYDFAGQVGNVYNLLSDEYVQVNAKIGQWRWNRKETIIKELGFKAGGSHVHLDAGANQLDSPGFSVKLNNNPLEPDTVARHNIGNRGFVSWRPVDNTTRVPIWNHHHAVAVAQIVVGDYNFEVFAIEEGKDENGVWYQQPVRYLDFVCDMMDTARRPHGLFGQSAHLPRGKRSIEGWSIEGEAADYQVKGNDILGDNFTFNKFASN